ncbi:hypothetical protein [Schaalia sp. Marseille-Q2122]|uniref:hypothetical protein n=1 Tax=Schaalia sp. Marseille-Q2122 TaxID=2736604 RepID=UPI00158ED6CF|nr:hypothetical protein [Schaalia sp. Marseille-Q2122]
MALLGSELALTIGAQGRAGDMVRQARAELEAAWGTCVDDVESAGAGVRNAGMPVVGEAIMAWGELLAELVGDLEAFAGALDAVDVNASAVDRQVEQAFTQALNSLPDSEVGAQ